jgi:hypothetical protein
MLNQHENDVRCYLHVWEVFRCSWTSRRPSRYVHCNLVDALRVSARFIRHPIYTSLYQLYRQSEFCSSDGLFELHMAPFFFEME